MDIEISTENKGPWFDIWYSEGCEKNSRESYGGSDLLEGFVDANYAGDLDTKRSIMGYLFCMFGGSMSWRSILQPITALSTIEVEYIGITKATKEALRLRRLVAEMGVEQSKVTLYCDS